MTGVVSHMATFWYATVGTYFAIVRYASICSACPAVLSSRGSSSGRKLQLPGGPAIAIITHHLVVF